ncbi:Protein of unknown function [Luteibacter sp. UNC138MFCol5.1]|uniref:lysozyme inhibitor LprI family protein n=1 Tax=Luteibacter sp. UNC138MFCol5.1 TaxID=1502774 RepID=UPI0008B90ADC|nr:lysozyme inhibitor LprI family protein [Luteibacter sp. UNC138MFCol5.1]SEP09381.1 Protein of unknown function [Luteibacter sp. UNC138MFCol5.1]
MRITATLLSLAFAAGTCHAAGFDCGKASTAVEKAICASPAISALDGDLGEAFRAALKNHPDKADALKLDQRHWLAERDASVAAYLSDHPGKALAADVARYPARIAFLRGLDAKAPKPLDVVQASLPRLPKGSDDVLADLAKAGASVAVAAEVSLDDAKAFPFEPDAAVKKALAELDASSGYRKLDGMPVSSVFSVGGTASCWTEVPFRIDGRKAIAVDAPGAWASDCMSRHGMARVGSDVIATVLSNPSPDEMNLGISRWEGTRFGPDAQLTMRFDHALVSGGSACAPKQSPCEDFAAVAMAAAARYERSPVQGTLDRPLKGAAKASYDALLAAARAPGGLAPKGESATFRDLPDFGGAVGEGMMTGYGDEATFFPIDFRGETLLGYIGHGHVGWRVNDDWMLSAWRLKAGTLEPVASMYVKVERGALLLSAVVPAPEAESR